jgi:HAD superfamily hydrolase (TIGR01509 family)
MTIKGLIFDFDGTLTMPGAIDFAAIRSQIGCPEGRAGMFEFIMELPTKRSRERAHAILEAYELQGALRSVPEVFAEEVVLWLVGQQLKVAVLTRNSTKALFVAFNNFRRIKRETFNIVITRELTPYLKPEPYGVKLIAEKLSIEPSEMLVVGDYVYDIEAGRRAGALTAFLVSKYTKKYPEPPANYTISSLNEICAIVEKLQK